MLKEGKRPFYIITMANQYDGLDLATEFITADRNEAIKRFKWLYWKWYIRNYTNDEGEYYYNGRDIHVRIDPNHPEKVKGNFYYDDDDGGYLIGHLDTIYTNQFHNSWNNCRDDRKETEYATYSPEE